MNYKRQGLTPSMLYYGYRYYSPKLGRWISRDPLGEAGGLNLYVYGQNSPLNGVDPDGRSFWGNVGVIAGLAVVTAVAVCVGAAPVAVVAGAALAGAIGSAMNGGDAATGALAGAIGGAVTLVAGPAAGGAVGGGLSSYLGALESGQPQSVAVADGVVGAVAGGFAANWADSKGVGDVLSGAFGTIIGGLADLVTNLTLPPPPDHYGPVRCP